MERAFLEGYGLNKDQIDAIMDVNGRDINAAKDGKDAAILEAATLRDQLSRYADYDQLQQEVVSLREGNTELASLREYKDQREYGDRLATAMGDQKFVNDVTRDHVFGKFMEAAKDPANSEKKDEELLKSILDGHEGEYIKGKVTVTMTPTASTTENVDDFKAYMDKKYANNPFYHG